MSISFRFVKMHVQLLYSVIKTIACSTFVVVLVFVDMLGIPRNKKTKLSFNSEEISHRYLCKLKLLYNKVDIIFKEFYCNDIVTVVFHIFDYFYDFYLV